MRLASLIVWVGLVSLVSLVGLVRIVGLLGSMGLFRLVGPLPRMSVASFSQWEQLCIYIIDDIRSRYLFPSFSWMRTDTRRYPSHV